jgi:hypothetical protein
VTTMMSGMCAHPFCTSACVCMMRWRTLLSVVSCRRRHRHRPPPHHLEHLRSRSPNPKRWA